MSRQIHIDRYRQIDMDRYDYNEVDTNRQTDRHINMDGTDIMRQIKRDTLIDTQILIDTDTMQQI